MTNPKKYVDGYPDIKVNDTYGLIHFANHQGQSIYFNPIFMKHILVVNYERVTLSEY